MAEFDGILICTDIDGTLTDKANKISEENLNAIKYFQDKGGLFTVATGRYPDYILNYGFCPNAPVIAIGGTVIYDLNTKKLLFDYPLGNDYKEVIIYVLNNHPEVISVNVYTFDKTYTFKRGESPDINILFPDKTAYKVVYTFGNETDAVNFKNTMISRPKDNFDFIRSWSVGVEMNSKSGGKGNGILKLKSLIPSVHTAIAAGNYENDISMIEAADIGFATDNAIPSVKAASDRILPSNNDNAIAHLIYSL